MFTLDFLEVQLLKGLIVCIIDHYPLGNQRTEISGGLNINEKLGTTLVLYCTPHPSSNTNNSYDIH